MASPISANKFKLRYTVPRLIRGNSSLTWRYTVSAVGCEVVLSRYSLIEARCLLYFKFAICALLSIMIIITVIIIEQNGATVND